MIKFIFIIQLIIITTTIYSQNTINILIKAPKDSLNYYINQQIKRFNTHPEYHTDSIMEAGVIVYQRGEIKHARHFFEMAYKIHKKNGDKKNMARSNANIAVMYELEGMYDNALKRYHISLQLTEDLKNSLSEYEMHITKSKIYTNIGVLYNEIGDYKKAYPYLKKSIEEEKKIIDICKDSLNIPKYKKQTKISQNGIASSYNNIGYYWENKPDKNLDSALVYYQKANDIYKEQNSPYQYNSLPNIGIIYSEKGNYAKALSILEKCYKIIKKRKIEINFSAVYHSLAYTYTQTNQYSKAYKIINEGIEFSKKNKLLKDEIELMVILFKLETKEGKYKQANQTIRKLITLKDSLMNKQKNEEIVKQEVKYETKRKEYEAKLAKEELKTEKLQFSRQRAVFLTITLIIILIIIIIAFGVWRKRLKEKQNKLILEQKLFRTQINPHFMFNSLGAIQAYMLDHKNEESMEYLLSFSSLMRNILDSSRSEEITIEKEQSIINDYLRLQKLRFENKFEYKISIDKVIDIEKNTIPPMLLQPFVENAVEHGIKSLPANKQGIIEVSFIKEKQYIQITVKDNGNGIQSKSKNKKHISHAINITNERIKTINKLKKHNIKMQINSSENNGTEVIFTIKN